jgi:PiT family inorganic phosphate transporter
VRWNVANSMLTAWVLTLPAAGIIGFIASRLLRALS